MPLAPDLSGVALDERYELHSIIGEGTFGRVYRGRDRRLARWVAVKVIKPWWGEDPEWARSFEREAQLLASISHPGIVQIFDVGSAPEGLYYVAELIDGQSLATRLRYGPVAPEVARDIAIQLCLALATAHDGRIVHRDVKPENVLIAGDGKIKVGDFGVARLAESSSDGAAATAAGTPRYMAPEQARGGPIAPATDVYGVGVVLYEMLCGHPPFEGHSAVELALAHLTDPPPPLPERVPSELAEVVERALAKDPQQRYRDGGEMAAALSEAGGESDGPRGDARSNGGAPGPEPTPEAGPGQDPTRVGDPRSPRRNVNPAERRQRIALFALVLLLVAGGVLAGVIALAPAQVRLPDLRGMNRAAIVKRMHHLGLGDAFAKRPSSSVGPGLAISQEPPPSSTIDSGSVVRVALSSGPPPVEVPQLVGGDRAAGEATLAHMKLRETTRLVPAPRSHPGLVTHQSPAAGSGVPPGTAVTLDVAETPRWRPLTSFTGGDSVPFRILGRHWRLVYSMRYQGICTFIFFCSGPNARVTDLRTGRQVDGFGLAKGTDQFHAVAAGPGLYQVTITPGSDTARWSIDVQDRY